MAMWCYRLGPELLILASGLVLVGHPEVMTKILVNDAGLKRLMQHRPMP